VGGVILALLIAGAVAWFWCGVRPSYFRGKKVEAASAQRLATLGKPAAAAAVVEDWGKSDRNLLSTAAAEAATPTSRVAYNPIQGLSPERDAANTI